MQVPVEAAAAEELPPPVALHPLLVCDSLDKLRKKRVFLEVVRPFEAEVRYSFVQPLPAARVGVLHGAEVEIPDVAVRRPLIAQELANGLRPRSGQVADLAYKPGAILRIDLIFVGRAVAPVMEVALAVALGIRVTEGTARAAPDVRPRGIKAGADLREHPSVDLVFPTIPAPRVLPDVYLVVTAPKYDGRMVSEACDNLLSLHANLG